MKVMEKPTILIDKQEQLPWFKPGEDGQARYVLAKLATGDYSLKGFEGRIAFERKRLLDLFSCVGRERERFERELARLSEMEFAWLVIEANWLEMLQSQDYTLVHPNAVRQSLAEWEVRFGVRVVFFEKSAWAAAFAKDRLLKFWHSKRKHGGSHPRDLNLALPRILKPREKERLRHQLLQKVEEFLLKLEAVESQRVRAET